MCKNNIKEYNETKRRNSELQAENDGLNKEVKTAKEEMRAQSCEGKI